MPHLHWTTVARRKCIKHVLIAALGSPTGSGARGATAPSLWHQGSAVQHWSTRVYSNHFKLSPIAVIARSALHLPPSDFYQHQPLSVSFETPSKCFACRANGPMVESLRTGGVFVMFGGRLCGAVQQAITH